MTVTILLKRSSTAGAVPTTGALAIGELAVNTTDGRVWTKLNSGAVAELTGKGQPGASTFGPPGPQGVTGPPGNSVPGPVGPVGPTTVVNI